jgi:hypothetical protein
LITKYGVTLSNHLISSRYSRYVAYFQKATGKKCLFNANNLSIPPTPIYPPPADRLDDNIQKGYGRNSEATNDDIRDTVAVFLYLAVQVSDRD